MGVVYKNLFDDLSDFTVVETAGTVAVASNICTITKDGTNGANACGIVLSSLRSVSEGDVFYYRVRPRGAGTISTAPASLNRAAATLDYTGNQYGMMRNTASFLWFDGDFATTISGSAVTNTVWYDIRVEVLTGGTVRFSERETPDAGVSYEDTNTTYDATVTGSSTHWSGGGSYAFMAQILTANEIWDVAEFYHTNNGVINDNYQKGGNTGDSGTNHGWFSV